VNVIRENATGAAALVRRDLLLFASYRGRLVTQFLAAFFSIALFYYISRLVRVSAFSSPDAYFAFAVVGLAIMEVVGLTLSLLPMKIRQELVAGTFERVVVSPFGPIASIVAMMLFPLAMALMMGAISLVFAAIVFGLPIEWSTAGFAVPAAVLAAAAFTPFALIVTAGVLAFKQAGAATGFIVTGLSLVGGFFFPVALLPGWIQWASRVQPFTPAVELLRHLIVGTPIPTSVGVEVLKLVLFGAVFAPVGLLALRTAVRFSQRRGTIIEY
jgi:ABC-2 type transport system permease protein